MGFAYVLYLNDAVAAPALELMRRVAQPRSRSVPHVTVRYSARSQAGKDLSMYDAVEIDHLELQGLGEFPIPRDRPEQQVGPKTIFVKCASSGLESLVYKPDYPDSVFHITLFDGSPSLFARDLSLVLRDFTWRLRVPLQTGTRLTRIAVGKDAKRTSSVPVLSADARTLFRRFSDKLEIGADVADLTDAQRLSLIHTAAAWLHSRLQVRAGVVSPTSAPSDVPSRGLDAEQLPLFATEEFDPSGNMLVASPTRRALLQARKNALFLTPPELAREMVAEAVRVHDPKRPLDFGDPALGNGIFLAALTQMSEAFRLRSAIGYELDGRRATVVGEKWPGLVVERGDFVSSERQEPRSLIVANPPYLRFQKLNRQQAMDWGAKLERELGLLVDGRSDLYVYFMLAAHAWMQPGAVACWVLPTEFMETKYGASLRDYLTTKVRLHRLHIYDRAHPQFDNAEVTSVVVLLENRTPQLEDPVILSTGSSLQEPDHWVRSSSAVLRARSRWSTVGLLKSPSASAAWSGNLLGDLLRPRRGIATGANQLFVISNEMVRALDVPRQWRKPVIPRARTLPSNRITAGADGAPEGIEYKWLIDIDEPWYVIEGRSAPLAAYLRSVQAQVGDRNLLRGRKRFYRQEQIPAAPFIFSYMAPSASRLGRSRFYRNCTNAVILNNYLGLFPTARLQRLLETSVIDVEAVFEMLLQIKDRQLAEGGRGYAKGLVKLEPSELANVPLLNSAFAHLARDLNSVRDQRREAWDT